MSLAHAILSSAIVNGPNTTGYISGAYWQSVAAEVLSQCDELDGVKDSIINRPGQCYLDYSKFECGSASSNFNSTTCLSSAQIETFKKIQANWKDPENGNLLFPAFNHGSEASYGFTVSGSPYGPAPSYFLVIPDVICDDDRFLTSLPHSQYQVLNRTDIVQPLVSPPLTINGQPVNESQLIDLIYEAQQTNPGMTTANDYDLSPFFKKGGKLILYVGSADPLIPTNSSNLYYERVKEKLGEVSDNFLFYEIPGLGHCSGGAGPSGIGLASQAQTSAGGATQSPPGQFNAKHDALLALMKWREEGDKPNTFIATKYNDNDINNGVSLPQHANQVLR